PPGAMRRPQPSGPSGTSIGNSTRQAAALLIRRAYLPRRTRRTRRSGPLWSTLASGFPIREEVRVDEVVDDGLMAGIDRLELSAHADVAIPPRDVPLGFDVALRSRHPEPDLDLGARFEGARRADGDPAVAQVERQCGGNRVAEAVLNGDPENHARAAAAVVVV